MNVLKVSARREISDSVTVSGKKPLGSQKSLHAHWSTSVDSTSWNANLGAKSESESISKASGTVDEDAGRVDRALEYW